MAKKKQEDPKVASSEETDVTVESTEETQEEAEKVRTGDTKDGKKYKLADPSTSYSEPRFTLAGDQEKELPENPSPQLIDRIRNGFIVEA